MSENILTDSEVESLESYARDNWRLEGETALAVFAWGHYYQAEAQAQRERAERAEAKRDALREVVAALDEYQDADYDQRNYSGWPSGLFEWTRRRARIDAAVARVLTARAKLKEVAHA